MSETNVNNSNEGLNCKNRKTLSNMSNIVNSNSSSQLNLSVDNKMSSFPQSISAPVMNVSLNKGSKNCSNVAIVRSELNVGQTIIPESDRETWNKKVDFLLSVIGFAVDLSNVWRFPYLCFKNGGGAFLIPYLIMLAVGGIPLFFMELALGQFHRKGAITCWGRIVPLFKGVGYSVVLIAFYVDFYYNVIIAWALHYFLSSFSTELPWTKCNNEWNTDECYEILNDEIFNNLSQSELAKNASKRIRKSAALEYFNRGFLQFHLSPGINNLGSIRYEIVLSLFAVYVICYFSLWKGISTSGKVVWFTALFPYVVLFILLIRGIMLPGALDGIKYYLTPDFNALYDANVWVDAATQVFFSLGPGFGVLLAFASYNEFHNNVHRDALLTSAVNCATSFLAGFVIFAVLGYMAHRMKVNVKDVAAEGPGLVFIVYPEAISTMPAGPVWAVIFFLMLLTLGLDSSFGGSEAIITALSDEYPMIKRNREIFVAILFFIYFMVGLLSCTQGGIYIVSLLDKFAAGYSILFAVLFETIAVSWIYGVKRFSKDIKSMLGFEISSWWKFCWGFVAPFFIMFIIFYGLVNFEPLKYEDYVYPTWANVVGFCIAASSVLCIPVMALWQIINTSGTFKERLTKLTTPWEDTQAAINSLNLSNDLKNNRIVNTNTNSEDVVQPTDV